MVKELISVINKVPVTVFLETGKVLACRVCIRKYSNLYTVEDLHPKTPFGNIVHPGWKGLKRALKKD